MSAGDDPRGDQPVAGPSRSRPETMEIPSYGLEFFEYRRRLFLAGLTLPEQPSSHLPATYTVPRALPEPLPARPPTIPPNSAIGRVATLLKNNGDDGPASSDRAWKAGIGQVFQMLDDRRKLTRPIPLSLVIQILREAWVRDGTWPVDPKTTRAINPPDSPTLLPTAPTNPASFIDPYATIDPMDLDRELRQLAAPKGEEGEVDGEQVGADVAGRSGHTEDVGTRARLVRRIKQCAMGESGRSDRKDRPER